MKKLSILFWLIVLLATVLRLYKLGSVPISPDWDEAALGYNAYTLLQTGRDEYGTWLPTSIRSFGDYKPPVYAYLTVPSVALFGLSVFAVRLPSAIMGILAVIGTYVLASVIVAAVKKKNLPGYADDFWALYGQYVPLFAMALLAVSPWHLQFSRIAFEANSGVTLHIWAITLFLLGLQKKWYLPLSAACFSVGMYAYHSERVFLPLMALFLIGIYRSELFSKNTIKYTIASALLGILLLIPLVISLTDSSTVARLKGTSSFTDQGKTLNRSIMKLQDDLVNGNKLGVFFDNRRFVWVKTFISGYISHFSLQWLFLAGDNPRHHAPSTGLLYLWELPFLLLGLYVLFRHLDTKSAVLIVVWILASPVAASVTTGLPHGVRTLTFLPTLQLCTALGLLYFIFLMKQHSVLLQRIGFAALFISICYGFLYYHTMYYVHMDAEVSEDWQYGYKEVVKYTEAHKSAYKKVVVSTSLDQSYIFFLFYTAYNPKDYLARGGTAGQYGGEVRVAFDAYEFRPIDWENEVRNGTVLYVGGPSDIPKGNVARYTYLNGKPSFELADR